MIGYISTAKPFLDPMINRIERFNELCILISSYLLLIFTDFVTDEAIQYNTGWLIISIALLNILLNFAVILKKTVMGVWHGAKRLYYSIRKYINLKRNKRILKN